jgi:hypothetical protein
MPNIFTSVAMHTMVLYFVDVKPDRTCITTDQTMYSWI